MMMISINRIIRVHTSSTDTSYTYLYMYISFCLLLFLCSLHISHSFIRECSRSITEHHLYVKLRNYIDVICAKLKTNMKFVYIISCERITFLQTSASTFTWYGIIFFFFVSLFAVKFEQQHFIFVKVFKREKRGTTNSI